MKTFEFRPFEPEQRPLYSGYRAPSGYHEAFANRLLEHPKWQRPVASRYVRRPWAVAAVWLVGLGLLTWGWQTSRQEAQQQVVAQYLEHQAQLSVDEVAPLLEPHHIQELEHELIPAVSPQAIHEQLEQNDALNFDLL